MRNLRYMFLPYVIILLSAGGCNTQARVHSEAVSPSMERVAATASAEADEAVSTPTPQPTENPTPNPTPDPTPTPVPVPPETKETVSLLLAHLKENRQKDIQALLTEAYDFDGDTLLDKESFAAYVALSTYDITEENFMGAYSLISVEVNRPDTQQIQNDYYDLVTDEDSTFSELAEDYVAGVLATPDCPYQTSVYTLTVLETGGEWKIEFNYELLELISQTYDDPFAGDSYFDPGITRSDRKAYIAEHIGVSVEDGVFIATNNGDKSVSSLSLKLEYIDKNDTLRRTEYYQAFTRWGFDFLNRYYEMKPGYQWAAETAHLFSEKDEYDADLAKCKVSVFDVAYEDAIPTAPMSTLAQDYADQCIAIDAYKIEWARSIFWSGYGVTNLKINNKGEKTVTQLSLSFAFLDKDGITRSEKVLAVIGQSEEEENSIIPPGDSWSLGSRSFFPLHHVPAYLAEGGEVVISINALDFE